MDRFLGEPDKLITNPVVRSQGRMRMYLESRAAAVETTAEWAGWVAAHAQRVARVGTAGVPRPDLIGRGRTGDYPVTRRSEAAPRPVHHTGVHDQRTA